MNIKYLETFLKVAELKNFTRAAEQLGLSQPAISFQIKALEEELQVTLLERHEKKIMLTPAGRVLYPEIKQFIRHFRKIRAIAEEMKDLKTGHLIAGVSRLLGEKILPALLGAFREQYPGIQIVIRSGNSSDLLKLLKDREIDCALVAITPDNPSLEYELISRDEAVFICPPWHHWANTEITAQELCREVFLVRENDSALKRLMDTNLIGWGLNWNDFKSIIEIDSLTAIIKAVSSGLGCGLVNAGNIIDEINKGEVATFKVVGFNALIQYFFVRHLESQNIYPINAFLQFTRNILSR